MDIELERMITANISLDIFAILVTCVPIGYLLINRRYQKKINLYFLGVALSNIFMIIGDIFDWSIPTSTEPWQKVCVNIGGAVFYTASAFVLYFFARYITEYLRLSGLVKKICLYSVVFVCAVQIFFAVISPFTGWIFYTSDEGYQRGSLFIISQLVPLFCYLLFTVLIVLYHKQLKKREIVFFLLYIFVPLGGGAAQMFTRGIAVVNIGVAFALLFILVNIQFEHEVAIQEQEMEIARREKELAEQRIDIMLSQIQPHFLYNSLGAIAQLCKKDPQTAIEAIQEFSSFLRGNMDSLKAREPIPFEKELNHAMNYLYLEQKRFGKQLRVIYRITATDFDIPPLTLQPLVENAVQHGIVRKREGGTVIISTAETDEYAVVTIEDDGIGMEKAKESPLLGDHSQIGISNVRSRLKEMVDGSLEVESSDKGTTVTMRIPWRKGYSYEIFSSR